MKHTKIGRRGAYLHSVGLGIVVPFACAVVAAVLPLFLVALVGIALISPILGFCGLLYREDSEPVELNEGHSLSERG